MSEETKKPKGGKNLATEIIESGMTINAISEIFGRSHGTTSKLLEKCPIHRTANGRNYYRFDQAAKFMVEPHYDIGEYISYLKKADLPPEISQTVWNAELSKQKWRIQAGELWHTDQVRELFASVFRMLRSRIQLFSEQVDASIGVEPDVKAELRRMSDSLQDDLHKQVKQVLSKSRTPSSLQDEQNIRTDYEDETNESKDRSERSPI